MRAELPRMLWTSATSSRSFICIDVGRRKENAGLGDRTGRPRYPAVDGAAIKGAMIFNCVLYILQNYIMPEPFTLRYFLWELSVCVFVIWDLVTIPLEAFQWSVDAGSFSKTMRWMVRLFWTSDVCI